MRRITGSNFQPKKQLDCYRNSSKGINMAWRQLITKASVLKRIPIIKAEGRAIAQNGYKRNESVFKANSAVRSSMGVPFGRVTATSNSYGVRIVAQRYFASGVEGDDDDGVEARLLRGDDSQEGMFMSGPSYATKDFAFDDYQEGQPLDEFGEQVSMEARDGGDMTEEDSGDDMNDPSDEEFEGEKTDEELDELLANTPLFDPPEYDPQAGPDQEFSFRPEGPVYYPGMEYDPEELDVTRPLPARRREPREKEAFTVEEVIDKADFRNVRFLTKFITETGNIIARKEFKMRNKSHNRITKAIKTARFFGLIPYTNMGRPKYVFNEPFDEMAEFYSTDEDEISETESGFQGRSGTDGRFMRRFPQRRGGFTNGPDRY